MFDDLFSLIRTLEHDYREENGEVVHSYRYRRCALSVRLSQFKIQIARVLQDIDFGIGDSIEKKTGK